MSKQTGNEIPFENLFFSKTADFLDVFLIKQANKSEYTKKQYKTGLSEFYDYLVDVRHLSADCR